MNCDDISKPRDHRAIEAAANANSSFDFEVLIGAAPAMIAMHEGPEHRFIYSNPAHDQAVEYRRLIGLPIREAVREVEGQNVFEHFNQVFHTGKPDEQTEFRAILELVPRERTARYYRQTLNRGAVRTAMYARSLASPMMSLLRSRPEMPLHGKRRS
jgi:hypothetical protein